MKMKTNIKALTHEELAATLGEWGVEGYRFNQIYRWLYQKDVADFEEMTNVAKALRARLAEHFTIGRFEPAAVQTSEDGTRKFLFRLGDHESVEAVLIPNGARQTLCISVQVGCAMACRFCLTGSLGLTRNLTHFEIVEQVMAVRRVVMAETHLTNVVYMGMGEPMHNLEHVLESLKYLEDERGLNFSKHKITVSTCGLVPQMLEFGQRSDVKLAVSLTATTDATRNEVIPVNRKYNLEKLIQACRDYPLGKRNKITFEYTLLKGVNDSLEDARRLVQLLTGFPFKINLIPLNEYPGCPDQRSSDTVMRQFQKFLLDRGIQTNIRQSRGQDILGACGQLKAAMSPKSRTGRPLPSGSGSGVLERPVPMFH